MSFIAVLMIIAAFVIMAVIGFGMMDAHVMPWSCPRCHAGSDEDIAGQHRPWYIGHKGAVQCRSCRTWFKEHPNGSLVEDRES